MKCLWVFLSIASCLAAPQDYDVAKTLGFLKRTFGLDLTTRGRRTVPDYYNSGSCPGGTVLNINGRCEEPIVERRVFVYSLPEHKQAERKWRQRVPVVPNKNVDYNVVLINKLYDEHEHKRGKSVYPRPHEVNRGKLVYLRNPSVNDYSSIQRFAPRRTANPTGLPYDYFPSAIESMGYGGIQPYINQNIYYRNAPSINTKSNSRNAALKSPLRNNFYSHSKSRNHRGRQHAGRSGIRTHFFSNYQEGRRKPSSNFGSHNWQQHQNSLLQTSQNTRRRQQTTATGQGRSLSAKAVGVAIKHGTSSQTEAVSAKSAVDQSAAKAIDQSNKLSTQLLSQNVQTNIEGQQSPTANTGVSQSGKIETGSQGGSAKKGASSQTSSNLNEISIKGIPGRVEPKDAPSSQLQSSQVVSSGGGAVVEQKAAQAAADVSLSSGQLVVEFSSAQQKAVADTASANSASSTSEILSSSVKQTGVADTVSANSVSGISGAISPQSTQQSVSAKQSSQQAAQSDVAAASVATVQEHNNNKQSLVFITTTQGLQNLATNQGTPQLVLEASDASANGAPPGSLTSQTVQKDTPAQTPIEAAQPPVEAAGTPVEASQTAGEAAQAIVEAAQSTVEVAQIPVEAAQTPVEVAQIPVEAAQTPVEASQTPVEAAQTPVEAAGTPVEASQTAVEAAQAIVEAAQSTVELAQIPVEAAQTPVEVAQIPVDAAQTPVEASQTPVEAAQTLTEVAQTPVEAAQHQVEAARASSSTGAETPQLDLSVQVSSLIHGDPQQPSQTSSDPSPILSRSIQEKSHSSQLTSGSTGISSTGLIEEVKASQTNPEPSIKTLTSSLGKVESVQLSSGSATQISSSGSVTQTSNSGNVERGISQKISQTSIDSRSKQEQQQSSQLGSASVAGSSTGNSGTSSSSTSSATTSTGADLEPVGKSFIKINFGSVKNFPPVFVDFVPKSL